MYLYLFLDSFILVDYSYYDSNRSCSCLLELESPNLQLTPLSIIVAYPAIPSPAQYADEATGPAGSSARGEADTR